MTGTGTVLVVDERPAAVEEQLGCRGLNVEVATDLESALAVRSADCCCVVCGQLSAYSIPELVARLGQQSFPVLFVYRDAGAAATALDAGAAATVPRRESDSDWGAHLAATVDSVRRADGQRRDGALLSSAIDELPDIFFVVSVGGTFLRWNDELREVTGYADEEIGEMQPTDFFGGEDVARVENAVGRVVMNGRATEVADVVTRDGKSIPYELTGSLIDVDGARAIVGTGRDIRERRERERELADKAERLASLNNVNEIIRNVTRALIETETREEIEQTVCEQIAESDRYRFAWVGEYDPDSTAIEPRGWAGDGEGYLEDRPAGGDGDELVTALTATSEQEVIIVQDIASDQTASGWRAAALSHGHESAAAIPIAYRGATFGCLCLYAGRPHVFGVLEREVLGELGEMIGHAIHAADTRRALASDTVTELQLRVTDPESFLVQAAEETEAHLELVGATSKADGSLVQLFSVRGIPPEAVRSYAVAAPMPATVVTERSGECLVKATLEGDSVPHALAEFGGTVRTIVAEDGEARMGVEIPRDVDVSTALDQIQSVMDVQLLSQREVERDRHAPVDFRADLEQQLTDRQRDVLEMAFRAGFFDWPREQTGEDIASLLDVSPPTFHQHLRVGERKLLEVLFEQESSPGRTGDGSGVDSERPLQDDGSWDDEPTADP